MDASDPAERGQAYRDWCGRALAETLAVEDPVARFSSSAEQLTAAAARMTGLLEDKARLDVAGASGGERTADRVEWGLQHHLRLTGEALQAALPRDPASWRPVHWHRFVGMVAAWAERLAAEVPDSRGLGDGWDPRVEQAILFYARQLPWRAATGTPGAALTALDALPLAGVLHARLGADVPAGALGLIGRSLGLASGTVGAAFRIGLAPDATTGAGDAVATVAAASPVLRELGADRPVSPAPPASSRTAGAAPTAPRQRPPRLVRTGCCVVRRDGVA